VLATIELITETPLADEVWSRTVAGPAGIFKRISPQIGEDSPIGCLLDIPASTPVSYNAYDPNTGNPVPVIIGNPSGQRTGAELYFAHLGGVYEYFLKGIQTFLRPKGYGTAFTSGTACTTGQCGELPSLPTASGSCVLGGISSRVGNIPQSLRDIVEAASETYKTPPNLILAIMYGEGLFNPGRFDWSDANVTDWATCVPIPGCTTTGADNFMGFYASVWQNVIPHIEGDLRQLDPSRPTPSQCNLLDSIYGIAWSLHDSADGGMGFTCFGINLNASVPNSCSWDANQFESAIKVSESGYTSMCLTREGSCATGGGPAAACPSGDTCETVGNRYADPSHNGCVWDVAHGN
jgi:hypothetical protein